MRAGQELEKDVVESPSNPLSTDKKLAIFDKIFITYQDAKRHIREDLVGCHFQFTHDAILKLKSLHLLSSAVD